jgi:hypothetical protein
MAAPTATRGRATGAVRDVRGAISHSSSPRLGAYAKQEAHLKHYETHCLRPRLKAPDRLVGCSVTTRGPED